MLSHHRQTPANTEEEDQAPIAPTTNTTVQPTATANNTAQPPNAGFNIAQIPAYAPDTQSGGETTQPATNLAANNASTNAANPQTTQNPTNQTATNNAQTPTLAITADKQVAAINENITFTANSTGTIAWSDGGNPATGTGSTFTTRFATAGQHTVQCNLTANGGTSSATATVTIREDSGAQWVARFPGSTSTGDLAAGFQTSVDNFIDALQTAGATVSISATLRPPERAYLMHYAWAISHGTAPATVPAMAGVDISWLHYNANGDPDVAASQTAAAAMVSGYNIVHQPSLTSRHTEGRAIDMDISWSGNLTIANASGQNVTISSTPRTGAGNTQLHAVGATYGAHKLVGDAPHWSDDGH